MKLEALKRLRIGPKLIAAFLVIGIIPFAVVGITALDTSSEALNQQAFNQLKAVRGIKKAQIETFMGERQGDMGVLVDTVGAVRREAFSKLVAVREVKRIAIERYFQNIADQVVTLSEDRMIVDAMRGFREKEASFQAETDVTPADVARMRKALKSYWTDQFGVEYRKQNEDKTADVDGYFAKLSDRAVLLQYHYIQANANPLGSKHLLDRAEDGSGYSALHAEVHPVIRSYLEKFSYYDIFLIEPESGRIVYSVFKELDYNTSLLSGPWADTNFAEVFKQARQLTEKDGVAFVDYAQYAPSYDSPASFIASPIFDGGALQGVLIFQMPLDRITEVMAERAGLGETGETYLVGPDKLMRSDSYLDPKHHSVGASFRHPEKGKVETTAAAAALAGKTGAEIIIDYNGNPVLSAYTPVEINGLTWGLLAEIDVAEAFVPRSEGAAKDFYAQYIEKYGYYDLFVMNPDGYVFYTVTHEADYQTNMVDGKFSTSNLGGLVRRVMESKSFGLADFAPYAPSNNEPAAFIAQPVVNGGKVELVVALQLSLKAINAIMQQRDGMGETGETYLVGSDNLMRSDSYLDPKHHSVVASFADPAKGRVDTVAAKKALAGETGAEIVIDYNGNPVLSAYTPVRVGGTIWALLAEIDEAEAFAAIDSLTMLMLVIGLVGLVAIVAIGYFLARSVSRPIVDMTGAMSVLAEGDKTVEIPAQDRADEVGDMAAAVQVFKDNMIRNDELLAEQEAERAAREARAKRVEDLTGSFDTGVGDVLKTVASASTELDGTARSMSETASDTTDKASAVAAASEQTTTNVQTVASATEELSASIAEINRQVLQSTEITVEAVRQAESTNETVQSLDTAAQKISEVVDLINDIAGQTNLLALNATIEAARAGDAGKGFAVVASEVKNLATQTAKATDEIADQITAMQEETRGAVSAIQGISGTIEKINEIATTISSAVEQQGAATSEISRSVAEASRGTQEVSGHIAGVSQAATDTGEASGHVLDASRELSQQSETLRQIVEKFLADVRAA
ncbi:MAG: methyl-accepting chemotaxis protein [Alphaproteobacteria bacterium]|jgi:methyl-accepting chemotaxis protein|nr:methyl-accepting chemotaxis protein [Alphaproteobacteria bacterium]